MDASLEVEVYDIIHAHIGDSSDECTRAVINAVKEKIRAKITLSQCVSVKEIHEAIEKL